MSLVVLGGRRPPIQPHLENTEMRAITSLFIMTITAALSGPALSGPALASPALARPTTDHACAVHAKQEVLGCREECTGDFQNAKLLCRDIETECGLQCLGHRESCIETAVQPLQDCLGICRDTLESDKSVCAGLCGADTACFGSCVDQAQVPAFNCRDDCEVTHRTNGGDLAVDVCRQDFKNCVALCPRAPNP